MDRARKYVLIGSALCLVAFAISILGTTAGLTAWLTTPPPPAPSPKAPWMSIIYEGNAERATWCWVMPLISMYIPLSYLYQQFFRGRWPNEQWRGIVSGRFEFGLWAILFVWTNWVALRPMATLFSTHDAIERWQALITIAGMTVVSVLSFSVVGCRFLIRSWPAEQQGSQCQPQLAP